MKKTIFIIFLIINCLILFSCDKNEDKEYIIILHYSLKEKEDEVIKFKQFSNVELEKMEVDGYIFLGWFEGDNLINEITENRDYDLTTCYEEKIVTISVSNNINSEIITENIRFSEFPNYHLINKDYPGYTFLGFYEDDQEILDLNEFKNYNIISKYQEKSIMICGFNEIDDFYYDPDYKDVIDELKEIKKRLFPIGFMTYLVVDKRKDELSIGDYVWQPLKNDIPVVDLNVKPFEPYGSKYYDSEEYNLFYSFMPIVEINKDDIIYADATFDYELNVRFVAVKDGNNEFINFETIIDIDKECVVFDQYNNDLNEFDSFKNCVLLNKINDELLYVSNYKFVGLFMNNKKMNDLLYSTFIYELKKQGRIIPEIEYSIRMACTFSIDLSYDDNGYIINKVINIPYFIIQEINY